MEKEKIKKEVAQKDETTDSKFNFMAMAAAVGVVGAGVLIFKS